MSGSNLITFFVRNTVIRPQIENVQIFYTKYGRQNLISIIYFAIKMNKICDI